MALDIQRAGVDVQERGKDETLDRRLFMQFLAFGDYHGSLEMAKELLAEMSVTATLYADINDPQGIGVVAAHEDPSFFVTTWRETLQYTPFAGLTPKRELTMFGRTYAIGYETDLEETLIQRPIRKITNPETPWAIWYPLRRKGAFEQLSASEQRTILMEHGGIGMAYGRAGHGTDIRLACHGLDQNDNDYVIALIGKELAPLSKIVERMRKTKQTAEYLAKLGPFFIGKAVWSSN